MTIREEGSSTERAPDRDTPTRAAIPGVTALLMLVGLSGIAIAQPVFDLLEKNAAELSPGAPSRTDLLVFAAMVVVVPPLVIWLVVMVARFVSARLARGLLVVALAGLAMIFGFEIIKQATQVGPKFVLGGGIVFGVALGYGVHRVDAVRTWLSYLSIAPIIFAVLFAVSSQVESLSGTPRTVFSHVRISAPHRLVMVVFDEFPERSILDGRGGIDTGIAPNLAALAGDGTWYRNTSTAAAWTQRAVPAILTGREPLKPNALPNAHDYPGSVFSLLESRYHVNASEGIESICPRTACSDRNWRSLNLGTGLRGVASVARLLYRNFADPRTRIKPDLFHPVKQKVLPRALGFTKSLVNRSEPTLDYLHAILPHQPWRFYGGARSVVTGPRPIYDRWPSAADATGAEQRHLLQVQMSDWLLGRVVSRLKAIGAYDDSVIVVTADHGVSFDPALPNRRIVAANASSVGFVPLVIKSAGTTGGRVVDDPTSTVDILHLVANELRVTASGLTPNAPAAQRGGKTTVVNGQIGRAIGPGVPPATFQRSRAFMDLVGASAWPVPAGTTGRLYRMGPYAAQFGARVPRTSTTANERAVRVADPQARLTPWAFLSTASAGPPPTDRWLAVTVDERIAGFARQTASAGPSFFASLDPDTFHVGDNQVAVYAVSGNPLQPSYTPVALATPVLGKAVPR